VGLTLTFSSLLAGLWLLVSGFETPGDPSDPVGPDACRACHGPIHAGSVRTAHFHTSRVADRGSIKGSFSTDANVLRTRNPNVHFRMEERGDGFYQTAHRRTPTGLRSTTERFDLVFGSGRRGQTYLYWKGDLLFQLPVSYLTGPNRWVNTPGFPDGEIVFDAVVSPRCLECHATAFSLRVDGAGYGRDHRLGITCEVCHGRAARHVAFHRSNPAASPGRYVANPARLSRERQIDGCALCHSGPRQPKRPAFTYRPGDPLDDYLLPARAEAIPDVHANQVGLLRGSRCFVASGMTCGTCHDAHREERDTTALSGKCLQCHRPTACPVVSREGRATPRYCVDCHMPVRESAAIPVARFRSHAIGRYPEEATRVLERMGKAPDGRP
jgi:hypothetical protein